MAIRSKQIHPDQAYRTTTFGDIPVISRERLAEELVDAASWVDFAGGTLTLVTERHPTDAPNEMVTIRAMIQWKDRTDARPQPEQAAILGVPQVEVLPFEHEEPQQFVSTVLGEDAPTEPFEPTAGEPDDESVDTEAEDESSIPAEMRG